MATSLTQHDLEAGLRQLGLLRGSAVEVHSSLSSFGYVAGGAAAVVDALMEVVGPPGAILMSAYPVTPALPLSEAEIARGITWKVRILPEGSREKTGLGAVVEQFQKRPGVVLGSGLHRVAAWGQEAEIYAREGYRRLLEVDGWALLMGVGIDRLSSMHQAEEITLPEKIAALLRIPEDICRDYPPDQWGVGYGGTPEDAAASRMRLSAKGS